jgi:hypothetical protein
MENKISKIFNKLINFRLFGPVMSADTTWPMMKRSVELGARFLIKKPLDANTIDNLWQHLDLKFQRTDKIKDLFPGWSYYGACFFYFERCCAHHLIVLVKGMLIH